MSKKNDTIYATVERWVGGNFYRITKGINGETYYKLRADRGEILEQTVTTMREELDKREETEK